MSNYKVFQDNGVPIKAWVNGVSLHDNAREQLIETSRLPFIYKHIAVMPDCHWGMGSTIGSIVPTVGAVIPAAVGVDIGCGMIAVNTGIRHSEIVNDISEIRSLIEKFIPHGRTNHGRKGDRGAWHTLPDYILDQFNKLDWLEYEEIEENNKWLKGSNDQIMSQFCTLGTGNHFAEVCIETGSNDEDPYIWIMVHSGSRGFGNKVGTGFTKLAQELNDKYFIVLPNRNLAYFPRNTDEYDKYLQALNWCQKYAWASRVAMAKEMFNAIHSVVNSSSDYEDRVFTVHCHHNYAAMENHFGQNVLVTRKGAVRAGKGDFGIIPGSMGAKSYIVEGLGNPESFCSCSHGAGREYSRTEARRRFTVEEHIKATEGVDCYKDSEVLDETPAAYKSIDDVIMAQVDLVQVHTTLKQIICVKGKGE